MRNRLKEFWISRTRLTLVAVAALALAGCAPTAPEIAEPPALTQTQTPAPSPEEPVVAQIVIGSESITLNDDQGELVGEFSYFDESAASVVTAINDALDAEVEGIYYDGAITPRTTSTNGAA